VVALVVLTAVNAQARDMSFAFSLSEQAVLLQDARGATRVSVAHHAYGTLRESGLPELPVRIVNILLPQGEEIDNFEFTCTAPKKLRENIEVRMATERLAPGHEGPFLPSADAGGVFPPAPAVRLGTGLFHGFAIASFAVFPVRYDGSTLFLSERIELRLSTRSDAGAQSATTRKRSRRRFRQEVNSTIKSLVENPRSIDDYYFDWTAEFPAKGGFRPTQVPSVEGSPVDYVIITGDAMAAEYQRLADWKTLQGVPTVVRTTQWIQANYRNGVDLPETIRYFIRDAYEKWGVAWVLLGGDTDVIPARYAMSRYLGDVTLVPTDLYFGCLDGSWNASHDQYWADAIADDADLYAEVYVGRLPSSTVDDASILIDKIISYETPIERDFTDKTLLLAEVLFPPDWQEGDPIVVDGADLSDSMYVKSFENRPLLTTRAYETHMLHPGSIQLTKQTAIDSMNAGTNIVNHIGHGSRFNISCGDVSLVNFEADALVNQDRFFVLFMADCHVSAFDYDCLSERFMMNPAGGAVATIGASHLEFPTIDAYYMNDYYDLLIDQNVVRIGEAFARSRLNQTPWALMGETVDRWTHFVYTLLSDPELPVWTGSVDTVTVAHSTNVGLGTNNVSINVTAAGQPADSAIVCLSKGNDDYQTHLTDAFGVVTFDFTAESPGSVNVVVTGRNLARHQSYITVDSSAAAYVSYAGLTADDDSTGGSFGNGDGVMDAGETIDLTPDLINNGGTTSGDVSIVIRCTHALVTIVDSTASVGVIGSNETKPAQDPVRVKLAVDMPDETAIEFEVMIQDNAAGSWSDSFRKTIHAPTLGLTAVRIDDDPPLGNGNGIVEPMEEFLLFYGIKNYGTGTAYGLTATLRDLDSAFVFIDSTDSYPNILPFTAAENTSGFHIIETTTVSEHWVAVDILDLFGRTHLDTIELRVPGPPTSLSFDASLGVDRIEVAWSKSVTSDVSHYRVYHSTTPGGPHQLATLDPVEHTVFLDVGLSPNTRYHYVVTSIDNSGNESAPSAEYSVSTSPPQLPGFPIEMQDASNCSPAIGDIDGDGDKEIVAGNRYVYAWHHDGMELRDGDLDRQTWGILNTQGNEFHGAITLCRLDGDPGLEIVAADMYTKSVYCMNHTGDVLSGWPRVAENGFRAAPVAGDLDCDGVFEIVAVDDKGVIYVWNADGSEYRDGDGNPLTDGVFYRTPATAFHYQTPTVVDIDSDGRDEIILGTRSATMYALNEDGSSVPGWPYTLPGEPAGSFAAGDVDDDGNLELVCHTRTSHVFLFNHDGSVATGWPRYIPINEPPFSPSPALADFDGDGKLEIVLVGYTSSATRLCVIKSNGQDYPGWPITFNTVVYAECSPVVCDVDGDGRLDILIGDESRYIYAFDIDGQMIDGFPVATGDAVRATTFVDDVDQDGDVDLVVAGWDKSIYVWDLAGAYNENLSPWPTFHANLHRNGGIDFAVPTAAGDPADELPVLRPYLFQNRPNPFNPSTTIEFHVPPGNPLYTTLIVYDVAGARVRTLVDEVLRTGRYDVTWDGRDNRGSRVSTGLYFYQLRGHSFVFTKKMLLLK
jgi:hypothetical protein